MSFSPNWICLGLVASVVINPAEALSAPLANTVVFGGPKVTGSREGPSLTSSLTLSFEDSSQTKFLSDEQKRQRQARFVRQGRSVLEPNDQQKKKLLQRPASLEIPR